MAKIELYVAVEINDDAAAMLDATYVGGAAGAVIDLVRGTLATQKGFRKVNVDVAEVADDTDSDGDEINSGSGTPDPEAWEKAVDARDTARQKAQGKFPTPKGAASGRTGRPATLHNLVAEDGEPVRAAGPRSPENLRANGIKVWDKDSPVQSKPLPKNTGERVAPQRASKPVMKRRGQ